MVYYIIYVSFHVTKLVKVNQTMFYCWSRNRTICDGISDLSKLQETCGRPLGLSFDYKTGDLYVADAYYGLMSVPYDGGEATQVVSNDAQGNPFGGFLAGLDVDPQSGIVYFTQASSSYKIR